METDQDSKENDMSMVKDTSYEDKVKLCSIIANPMAPKKLTKKIYKLIKKGECQETISI